MLRVSEGVLGCLVFIKLLVLWFFAVFVGYFIVLFLVDTVLYTRRDNKHKSLS